MKTEKILEEIQAGVKGLQVDVKGVQTDVRSINSKLDELSEMVMDHSSDTDSRFARIESQMVTKSYLDDKLADFRGEFIATRKPARA